jgi:hypothetical protein
MVLPDVEVVFDSIWHEGLLQKLVVSNCYLYLTKIIVSFLKGRSFHVRINKTNSAQCNECETATFANNTAIFVTNKNPIIVFTALQGHPVTFSIPITNNGR